MHAAVADYERWRRVIVQNAASITFWRMDDTTWRSAQRWTPRRRGWP